MYIIRTPIMYNARVGNGRGHYTINVEISQNIEWSCLGFLSNSINYLLYCSGLGMSGCRRPLLLKGITLEQSQLDMILVNMYIVVSSKNRIYFTTVPYLLHTYSVSHNFIYSYIFAGNQGNHPNFVPSLELHKLWLIWIWMKQFFSFFWKKNSK